MAITLQHSPAKLLSSSPFEPSHSLHPHIPYPYNMRSFGLAVFASLTFGLFCSAAPTPLVDVDADVGIEPIIAVLDVDLDVGILRRSAGSSGGSSTSLDDILNGVIADITPIADKISKAVHFSIICQESNSNLVSLPHV